MVEWLIRQGTWNLKLETKDLKPAPHKRNDH